MERIIKKIITKKINKPEWIIIHHTATARDKTTFAAINRYHRDRWWFKSSLGFYIGYHYFINGEGKLFQGRADTDIGAHTIGKNNKSIGICLAGNFDIESPSRTQVLTLVQLLKEKMRQYNIPPEKIVPHRKFAKTNCYGKILADDWAQNLVKPTENNLMEWNTSPSMGAFNSTQKELINLLEQALKIAKKL
jgi:N-acetyl-anhydromuramyl-L-alanine amidase AmpD